jgi:hypothetical protein
MTDTPTPAPKTLHVKITICDKGTTLAQLDMPVSEVAAWRTYQNAINELLKPTMILTFPGKMSGEEVEGIRKRWLQKNPA